MPFLGEFAALFTAVLWSFSSLVFAEAAARVGSVVVNITRLALALVLLAALVLAAGIHVDVSWVQAAALAVSGVAGLTLGDTFLFRAFQLIGARVSMLVMSVAPSISALLAYLFLDEGLSGVAVAGMGVTTAGIALVVLSRSGAAEARARPSVAGIVYAVLGALGQGAGLIVAKVAFQAGPLNGFLATLIRIAAGLAVLVPLMLAMGKLRSPAAVYRADRRALAFTVAGSVLGPFLGIPGSLIAVANTSVGVASTLMATVPILMLPLVRLFYREELSPRSILGAALAVGGVGMLFLR